MLSDFRMDPFNSKTESQLMTWKFWEQLQNFLTRRIVHSELNCLPSTWSRAPWIFGRSKIHKPNYLTCGRWTFFSHCPSPLYFFSLNFFLFFSSFTRYLLVLESWYQPGLHILLKLSGDLEKVTWLSKSATKFGNFFPIFMFEPPCYTQTYSLVVNKYLIKKKNLSKTQ